MIVRSVLYLLLLVFPLITLAQSDEVRELEALLTKQEGTEKAETHLKLAKAIIYTRTEESKQHATEAIKIGEKTSNIELQIKGRYRAAYAELFMKNKDSFNQYIQEAKSMSEANDYERGIGNYYQIYAGSLLMSGFNKEALTYYDSAIVVFNELQDSSIIAKINANKVSVYNNLGWYTLAIEEGLNIIKHFESIGEESIVAIMCNNIATCYEPLKKFDEANAYYDKAIKLNAKGERYRRNILPLTNKGEIYRGWKQYDEAMRLYAEAYNIADTLGLQNMKAYPLINIGLVLFETGEYKTAYDTTMQALKIFQLTGDTDGLAQSYLNLAAISAKLKRFISGQSFLDSASYYADDVNNPDLFKELYFTRSEFFAEKSEFKNAYNNRLTYETLHDSIFNTKNNQIIEDLNVRYETEKKEAKLTLQASEIKQQKRQLLFLVLFLSLAAIFIVVVVLQKSKIKKQRNDILEKNVLLEQQKEEITTQRDEIAAKNLTLEQHKEEIETQRDEIEKQNKILEEQHNQIQSSINYAQHIQTTLLTPDAFLKDSLKEYFLLYRPKSTVSGDFYWVQASHKGTVVVTADCTGHSIPGAFMSVMGMTILDDIVTASNFSDTAELLELMRNKITRMLRQRGKINETRDGIDMSVYIIDIERKNIQFSGAYSPVVVVRNQTLELLKGDRQPVSRHIRESHFTTTNYALESGDMIYSFTDGYIDQLGGENFMKYSSKKLHKLLAEISPLPVKEQEDRLIEAHENWKADFTKQVDDILVLGVRV